jgi:hypothetical protein
MKKLNPDIEAVEIGIRDLRVINLYPLSYRDQQKASGLITEALQRFTLVNQGDDMAFVATFIDLLSKNLEKVLALVVDPKDMGDDILAELTNSQILEICQVIYEVNFEALQKKVKGLFGTMVKRVESLPGRPSPQSSEDTLSTDLRTSSESPGEKVE